MSSGNNNAEGKQGRPKRERLEVGSVPNALLEPSLGKKPVMKLDALPPSSVVERLKSFLPEMAAANDRLQQEMTGKAPGEFDIEEVGNGEESYIEMDLACGVVDLKDSSAVVAAERAIAGAGGTGQPSTDSESSSSDSEGEEENAAEHDESPCDRQQQETASSQEHDRSPAAEERTAGQRARSKGKPKIIEMP